MAEDRGVVDVVGKDAVGAVVLDLAQLLDAEAQAEIAAAFKRTGWGNIVGARELLGKKYDYGLLRIFRATANARRA